MGETLLAERAANQIVPFRDMANVIRALAMDAVEKAKSGHPGMPMGLADVAAAEKPAQEGVKAAVVSMPSWELFERQSDEYRR
ncbi:MAG: hypothetical protein P4L76_06415, partial [Beijerinckiaceae bacterium]|nr:hypothetical protein [Beijerinckiaceae bacterium]